MIPKRIRDKIESLKNFKDKIEWHPESSVNSHLGQVTTLAIERGYSWEVCYAALLHDCRKDTENSKK